MKLALDHHYSPLIADGLRQRGHDVIALLEAGWESQQDETVLERCAEAQRALLTNNVADFAVLAVRWASEGRSHHGLVFTSDASWPRDRHSIGRYLDALDELMRNNPDSFADRIHWL